MVSGSSSFPTVTSFDGNSVLDVQGSPTTPYWLTMAGAVGTALIGSNTRQGMVNPGISGGISSIVLGAGWGTTATTSAIVNNGNTVQFTITSSGTGQATAATITISQLATGKNSPPQPQCKNINSSGTLISIIGENNSTATAVIAVTGSAPAAGATYVINCQVQ
jgi:hypothetical protein